MVLALAAPCAQLRAETPATDTPTPVSHDTAQEIARLETMSLRDVGQPTPGIYLSSAASSPASGAGSGAWNISRVADTDLTIAGLDGSSSGDNLLYSSPSRSGSRSHHPTYSSSGIPGWVEQEFLSNWEIEGEIGLTTGSATYASNEGHYFSLTETYTSRSDNEFRFYQRYGVDHYYYNSRELLFGARQDFDSFWLNGGLRLTEEFRDYNDIGFSQNNRQTGLFKLRFDPQSEDRRWRGVLDYRYGVKTYETFSTRGYILHSGKFRLAYPISCTVAGEGRVRFDDYNYSSGSTRSFNRVGYGNTLTWEPSCSVRISAAVDKDSKDYEQSTDRNYERQIYQGALRWKPGCRTQIDLKGKVTDYDRTLNPERSYLDNVAEVRLQHGLSPKWDLDARIVERQKDYDLDPLDDLTIHRRKLGLNYNADCNWNFGVSWDDSQYDYAYLAREYDRNVYVVDGTYSAGPLRLSGAWRSTHNDYTLDPMRDYVRNDYDLDADWRCGLHRLRVYCGVAEFSQTDPASVNGYDETRYGAGWKYEMCNGVDFELKYGSYDRVYDTRDAVHNNRLFANVSFEL